MSELLDEVRKRLGRLRNSDQYGARLIGVYLHNITKFALPNEILPLLAAACENLEKCVQALKVNSRFLKAPDEMEVIENYLNTLTKYAPDDNGTQHQAELLIQEITQAALTEIEDNLNIFLLDWLQLKGMK